VLFGVRAGFGLSSVILRGLIQMYTLTPSGGAVRGQRSCQPQVVSGGRWALRKQEPAGGFRAKAPLGQREPTDGTLVRCAGHGEKPCGWDRSIALSPPSACPTGR